jgi:hypothetical protein
LYLKKIKSGEGARSIFWGAESGARSHGKTGAKSESSLYFSAASAERERALFSGACANTGYYYYYYYFFTNNS